MKWYFRDLQKYSDTDPFTFNEKLQVKAELLDRYADEVIDASDFNVEGTAFADRGDVIVDTHIVGKLVVPSSRSLVPSICHLILRLRNFMFPVKLLNQDMAKMTSFSS